jgi:hypothetical protein
VPEPTLPPHAPEKLMHTRLIAFIAKNSILTEAQIGFREGKSTETVIHDFLESVQGAIDERINLTGMFFYLSKAYDVLSHKFLLPELDAYGVRSVANIWLKSYLSNWKQCTEINYMECTKQISGRYTSDLKEIKHGVPKGSVLGPILFFSYISDLPINIQGAKTVLFADDTDIQIKAVNEDTLNQKINRMMQQLLICFHVSGLVINTETTTAMSFHTWQNKHCSIPQIIFKYMDIKYKYETKFLGLHLTEDIKWNVHIKN